jgi:hypothetical protein
MVSLGCGIGAAVFAATVAGGAILGTCAVAAGVVSLIASGVALAAHGLACNGGNQYACGQIGWDIAGIVLSLGGFGAARLARGAVEARDLGPAAARFAENCAGVPMGVGGVVTGVADWYYYERHQPGIAAFI